MKTVEFEFGGQALHLCLNGTALFDIYDQFGNKGSILDHIWGGAKGDFARTYRNTCWMLAKLAEQGELVRRYQGHDSKPIPTPAALELTLRPADVPAARRAIHETVRLGFARDVDDGEEEVDLGLLEIQKKTASGLLARIFSRS